MLDDREEYTPGWKYAEWELRGVPLRIEIGPRDIAKSQVLVVRRDTREKLPVLLDDLTARIPALLAALQQELLDRALRFRDEHTRHLTTRDAFEEALRGRPGFIVAPWCGREECEAGIKADMQATIRNIPLDPPPASGNCIRCGNPGRTDVYFAKAY